MINTFCRMNVEEFREYCLTKFGVDESFPFSEDTLVFKVFGKMFALTNLSSEEFTINLKCDPDWALELRESYRAVKPGFHMNKKHWNTVSCESDASEDDLKQWIDHSYDLVVSKLPARTRKLFDENEG